MTSIEEEGDVKSCVYRFDRRYMADKGPFSRSLLSISLALLAILRITVAVLEARLSKS